jgi:hypothetical protein
MPTEAVFAACVRQPDDAVLAPSLAEPPPVAAAFVAAGGMV